MAAGAAPCPGWQEKMNRAGFGNLPWERQRRAERKLQATA